MSPIRLTLGLLAILPGLAAAQQPTPQPNCEAERRALTAEETTPGILQTLAREALAACEQRLAAGQAARGR